MTSIRSLSAVVLLLSCAAFVHGQSELTGQPPNVKTINPTFTTIDVPGAAFTAVNGINAAGDMVGWYSKLEGGFCPCHSFQLSDGIFTFFDFPGAASTLAYAINDFGAIVGDEGDDYNIQDKGFIYDGSTFTSLRPGHSTRTFLYGINNTGDLVGGAGTASATKGLTWHLGKFRTINFPGSYVYAYGTGINNLGQIVGWASPDLGGGSYLYANGRFKRIAVPGASETYAWSINDDEVIVGYYGTGSGPLLAFAMRNGKYVSFGYPGASYTTAEGINRSGEIVGTYTVDFNSYHGFVTNPITAKDFQ